MASSETGRIAMKNEEERNVARKTAEKGDKK
jgi:hypothetical protein